MYNAVRCVSELSDRLSDARTAVLYVVMGLVLPRSSAAQAGDELYMVMGLVPPRLWLPGLAPFCVCVMGLWLPRLAPCCLCVLWVCAYPGWRRLYSCASMATLARAVLCVCIYIIHSYGSSATQVYGYPSWHRAVYKVMGHWLPRLHHAVYIVMGLVLPKLVHCCI